MDGGEGIVLVERIVLVEGSGDSMGGDDGGYSCGGLVLAWLWVCAASGVSAWGGGVGGGKMLMLVLRG